MSFNLETVQDYVIDARVLLLDTIAPYRYSDPSLLVALNLALLEGRRLRPDLFVYKYGNRVPYFDAVTSATVPIEPQFRKAFVYGMVAHALARDQEDVQDARSTSFMGVMMSILTGISNPTVAGAAPAGGGRQGGGVQLPGS